MDVGVAVAGGTTAREVAGLATDAEAAGLSSFWVAEGAGGDAFSLLSAAAISTSRIRLGTGVVSVYVRSLPVLAMASVTVNALSGGRFTLGLGPSHKEQVEGEHGLVYQRPLARMRDAVNVVRNIATRHEVVNLELSSGAIRSFHMRTEDPAAGFPIILGATGPKMLKLTGEIADGVIMVWRTVDGVAAVRRTLPGSCRSLLLLHCAVGSSESDCQEALDRAAATHSRFRRYRELFEAEGRRGGVTCVQGDSGGLLAQLSEYASAGLDEAVLIPVASDDLTVSSSTRILLDALQ